MFRSADELRGKNIVVYDAEIKNLVGATVGGKKITWDDHDLMGISCVALFDYETMDYTVYLADNMKGLAARLNRADMIVAFNQINFDNRLLRSSGLDLKPDSDLINYDILVEGRLAIGWSPGQRFPSGCKLDNFLEATFGDQFKKTAHGAEAPKMWQENRLGELISYCLADVVRERGLFECIWITGMAWTKEHGPHRFSHPEKRLRTFTEDEQNLLASEQQERDDNEEMPF